MGRCQRRRVSAQRPLSGPLDLESYLREVRQWCMRAGCIPSWSKLDLPLTLVEVDPFSSQIRKVLSATEFEELKWFIATNPTAGVVIPGTGGVRKLRWAAKGKGKRGGSRIIYFFYNDMMPVWLLAAYPKNAKAKLSESEKSMMRKLIPILLERYRGRRSR